jgi:hypothetical protein
MQWKWCYAGSIDNNGSNVKAFRRGSCTDNMLTFTAYSRFSKWDKTSNECRADSVEWNGRAGWFISMTCEGKQVSQFIYPMTKNRLGVMNTNKDE